MGKKEVEALLSALDHFLDASKRHLEEDEEECDCDEIDKEDYDHLQSLQIDKEDYDHLQSLQKDFKAVMRWAFGKNDGATGLTRNEAKRLWTIHHPEIPFPRAITIKKGIQHDLGTVCLLLDVYPLYLADKKK